MYLYVKKSGNERELGNAQQRLNSHKILNVGRVVIPCRRIAKIIVCAF